MQEINEGEGHADDEDDSQLVGPDAARPGHQIVFEPRQNGNHVFRDIIKGLKQEVDGQAVASKTA